MSVFQFQGCKRIALSTRLALVLGSLVMPFFFIQDTAYNRTDKFLFQIILYSVELRELIIEDENIQGWDAISLVTHPAIEENFVFFSKEEKIEFKADEERQMLVGPALVPKKKIYRKDGEHEYEVFFSVETVQKCLHLAMKNGPIMATIQHEDLEEQVHFVEGWIIENPEMDKAKSYGFDLPSGTAMVAAKIENKEVWELVKSGELRGFSIEGYFVDRIVNKNDMALHEALKAENKDLRAKLEKAEKRLLYKEDKLEDGTLIVTEAEAFEVGAAVFVLDEEGNPTQAPEGTHTLASGETITVNAEGVIEAGEEEETEAEDETKEQDFSDTQVEVIKEMISDALKGVSENLSAEVKGLTDLVNEIKDKPLAEFKKEPKGSKGKKGYSLRDLAKIK